MWLSRALKTVIRLPLVCLDEIGEGYSALVSFLRPGDYLWGDVRSARSQRRQVTVLNHSGSTELRLRFHAPNSMCQWRAATFSTKEPETLRWIDRFGGAGALFDVGANVGVYTVYYARTQPGAVYAFEPSVFNTSLLVLNVNANGVQGKVRILISPLSASKGYADFSVQSTDEGGALSAFGVQYGYDGRPIETVVSYQTYGFSLDEMRNSGMLPEPPALIKVDVDGIEHLILRGAVNTLAEPQCRSVLIEVNEQFRDQYAEVRAILNAAGFAEEGASAPPAPTAATGAGAHETRNQIWVKRDS